MRKVRYFGWSKTSCGDSLSYRPRNLDQLQNYIYENSHKNRQVIQRGQGRSYGDTAFCNNGVVISLDHFKVIGEIQKA